MVKYNRCGYSRSRTSFTSEVSAVTRVPTLKAPSVADFASQFLGEPTFSAMAITRQRVTAPPHMYTVLSDSHAEEILVAATRANAERDYARANADADFSAQFIG